ncbi:hypothetical protein Cgig2_032900 [Carnegiea gigantea]|uniref:Uncharacterized protein n=1 Tax=Carnegiea gigantea TaxID=171969 RepID=A0A9Q1JWZ6_9CARY|nr:hypothetical protein Cgig2_032900 [Carnegiea gigantea]
MGHLVMRKTEALVQSNEHEKLMANWDGPYAATEQFGGIALHSQKGMADEDQVQVQGNNSRVLTLGLVINGSLLVPLRILVHRLFVIKDGLIRTLAGSSHSLLVLNIPHSGFKIPTQSFEGGYLSNDHLLVGDQLRIQGGTQSWVPRMNPRDVRETSDTLGVVWHDEEPGCRTEKDNLGSQLSSSLSLDFALRRFGSFPRCFSITLAMNERIDRG